jgi:alpha-amylase
LEEAREKRSDAARFLRGGMWRNFQARYSEINGLHKQMLRASAAVAAMAVGSAQTAALEHLYRGQSNDCYWHGLFGGVYLPHMRMATLAELIAAEDLALGERPTSGIGDHDLDGVDEVLLGTPGQTLLVDPAEGGGIVSWDLRASRVALNSVLRRRPEAYHAQLRAMEEAKARGEAATGKTATSIHDQLMTKEANLSEYLVYDREERHSGLVRIIAKGTAIDFRELEFSEIGRSAGARWELEGCSEALVTVRRTDAGLSVRKTIALGGGRLDPWTEIRVEVANDGTSDIDRELVLEFNLNLLGGGGNPQAWYRWPDGEARHDSTGDLPAGAALSFGNDWLGVAVSAGSDPPARHTWYPVETVSNSEAGFERVYQGSCLLLRWPLLLATGERRVFSVRFDITQSRDLSGRQGPVAG